MRRVLVLLCLVIVAECRSSWRDLRVWSDVKNRRSWNHVAATARDIRQLFAKVDTKMQQVCQAHTNRDVDDAFGERFYKLRVNLTGCDGEVKVRSGQHIMSVQARSCDYIALRLLPEFVDSTSAFWRLRREQLTVYFPYSLERGRCGRPVSSTVYELTELEDDVENPDVNTKFTVLNRPVNSLSIL